MQTFIEGFHRCRLLVIGDLMLDAYIWGQVARISPEAPVPVVSVVREDMAPGGAGNVVRNLRALGAGAMVAGAVGPGADGRRLLQMFDEQGADRGGVIVEAARTTTRKTRIIAASQHVLRIDREARRAPAPAALKKMMTFIEAALPRVHGVLVSDYDKGLVTAGLMARVTEAARRHDRFVIVDPKGADFAKYRGASLLTPNLREAARASGIAIVDDDTLAEAARRLMAAADLDQLLITQGPQGMTLFATDRPPQPMPARARQVYDVSGAGDTVLAVIGLALAAGAPLPDAAALANTAAGIVVGKIGTSTVCGEELQAEIDGAGLPFRSKHLSWEALAARVAELRRSNRRIVLTNGCFDLLHAGHIQLFAAAKQTGDFLVVAIDDDVSVRALKGPGRPVIRAAERIGILSALDSVDAVVVFESARLEALIDIIRPDVLVKGGNYAAAEVRGGGRVAQHGGRVVLVPVSDDSATQIINRIKSPPA